MALMKNKRLWLQEGNLPDIEFHERGLSKIWEDIDRGNPIDFKVILRNNRKNDPEIHRVLLDKEIMCENHEGTKYLLFAYLKDFKRNLFLQ